MKKQATIDRFQITGFVIATVISIGVGVITGETVPSVILGLVLAVLTQLFDLQLRMTTSSEKLEDLSVEGIERVIRSLGGVGVARFKDSQQLYEYVTKRTREAKKTIDDMTMGISEREHTPAAQRAFDKYLETINTVCARGTIAYRELMSFPPLAHFDRAEAMLGKNYLGYRLKYYAYTNEKEIPSLVQFMVVDSEEVIIGFYRSGLLPAEREIRLSVRHPDIVEFFQDYYDTLWQGAKALSGKNRSEELAELQDLKFQILAQKK